MTDDPHAPPPPSRVRHVREIKTSDGRTLRIGDSEPVPPEPKLKVFPIRKAGEAGKSIRGAFTNGRGKG